MRWYEMMVCGFFMLVCFSVSTAQEGPAKKKGKIMIGDHRPKLEAGKLYEIRVECDGFRPIVEIKPGRFVSSRVDPDADTFTAFFMPQESREHRILIVPDLYDLGDGPFDYSVSVKPITLAEKPLISEKGKLSADDPVYKETGRPFKGFNVKMKARQVYVIEMTTGANSEFDPNVLLEGPDGMVVANSDNATAKSSRIIFLPRRDGDYRIVASTYSRSAGEFTLSVRAQASKESKKDD